PQNADVPCRPVGIPCKADVGVVRIGARHTEWKLRPIDTVWTGHELAGGERDRFRHPIPEADGRADSAGLLANQVSESQSRLRLGSVKVLISGANPAVRIKDGLKGNRID